METFEANLGVFVQWLLRATLQGSLLVCLIMLIKLILRERLPARWHYCLWLVLLIRLALPWAPHSRLSIYNVIARPLASHHAIPAPAADARSDAVGAKPGTSGQEGTTGLALTGARGEPPQRGQDAASVSAPPAATLPQTDSTPRAGRPFAESVVDVAPWVWLGGFLVLGGYISLRAFGLWRAVTSERPVTDQGILELLEDCKMQMRVRTIVGVVVTDKVQTPALFGFLRPRILLPQGLIETLGLDDLHYVLLHELAHLKRRDIYLAWLVCLLQVLHWFNPLIWFAFRRMRADQEMAADALALAAAGTEESRRYGQTILSFLERLSQPQYLPSLAGILENPSHIERRIEMIAKFKSDSYRLSALGIGVMVVLGAISMTDPTRATVSASSARQGKAPMAIRLVEENCTGFESVSPDGRYLCDYDGKEKAIAIREFATGERHAVKPTEDAPDGKPPIWFWPLVMSPDSKMVAYGIGGNATKYLCLIGADGSGQRVICPNVMPAQWFPDGSRILGIVQPGAEHNDARDIVSVSVSDGSVEKIKYMKTAYGRSSTIGLGLSPDARYVASDVPHDGDLGRCDIVVVEIDSKQEVPLVRHPADDRLLGWTPDGRHVLFASNRTGEWDAYLLPVVKGKVQGTPELVVRNVKAGYSRQKGFAQNGSYYYRDSYDSGTVHTAGIDLNAGQLLSSPVPLGAAGPSSCADWSPDGKRLAYGTSGADSSLIRIRTLATGEERELPHKLVEIGCLRWLRDGRSLLASGLLPSRYDKEEEQQYLRVCRIDVETGDSTLLLQGRSDDADRVRRAELSSDEKTLFYSLGYYGPPVALIRRQMDTGEEKKIFEVKKSKWGWFHWALSPNGEYIALGFNDERGESKVAIIPSEGGPELQRWDKIGRGLDDVAWSTDNKTVLFVGPAPRKPGKDTTLEFWQVTMEGGQARKIAEADLGWKCPSLRVHPDGRQVAFTTEVYHNELWVMENFLPAGAPASPK